MSVTITRVSAADLPCEVWAFPATARPARFPSGRDTPPGALSAWGGDGANYSFGSVVVEATVKVVPGMQAQGTPSPWLTQNLADFAATAATQEVRRVMARIGIKP